MTTLIPPDFPRWATDAAADITEPLEALKDTGWVGGATPDRPAAQHFNWLLNQNYLLHQWWSQFLIFRPSSDWVGSSNPFPGMDAHSVVINQVAYSPSLDLFVAVGVATSGAAHKHLISSCSTLGSWTIRQNTAASSAIGFYGVRWIADQSIFVAFGASTAGTGPSIYSSTNGTTWSSEVTSGFATPIQDVNWDPISALWTAIDSTLIRTSLSITAAAWTTRDTGILLRAIAVDPVNGITCVAAAGAGAGVRRTTDGTTYATVLLAGSPGGIDDVIYDETGSRFLVSTREPSTSYPALEYSANGATGTWTNVPSSTHGIQEALSPCRLGINPDYGHVMIGTYASRVFCGFPYSGAAFFERENPVGAGLWTGISNSDYFRPVWNMQPATKISRFWLLGGNSVGATNVALAESQVPVY